jgi:16S rRNA (guanine966-N2)-methyltransferase
LSSQKRKTRGSPSGRLRIVAGKWRSRLLPVVDEAGLRPTAERIRETLFNWLAPVIEGAACLDLYAGTGALGLEALSRGAKSAVFVENSGNALAGLRSSIADLDAENATVQEADAVAWLTKAKANPFDVVFLDPPFAADIAAELCRLLAERSWLSAGAHVYLEQDRNQPVPDLPQGWQLQREKTAGNVRYSLISVAN